MTLLVSLVPNENATIVRYKKVARLFFTMTNNDLMIWALKKSEHKNKTRKTTTVILPDM